VHRHNASYILPIHNASYNLWHNKNADDGMVLMTMTNKNDDRGGSDDNENIATIPAFSCNYKGFSFCNLKSIVSFYKGKLFYVVATCFWAFFKLASDYFLSAGTCQLLWFSQLWFKGRFFWKKIGPSQEKSWSSGTYFAKVNFQCLYCSF